MSLTLTPDRCFVVAEAGTAHAALDPGKRLAKALTLVSAAHLAGADAVKFQWFNDAHPIKDDMFCWIAGDENLASRWRDSSMPVEQWAEVKQFCDSLGIVLLASTFQFSTVAWVKALGLVATKVASRASKNFPYNVPELAGLPEPFLISTGMEVEVPHGRQMLLLECEAKYPSTTAWKAEYGGFSDHSGKPFLGIDAIARTCMMLEVHFMVDGIDAGPDLPACLTTNELGLICKARDYYAART